MTPLIAGNWKMNGLRADGVALAEAVARFVRREAAPCEVLLCPPATLLDPVAAALAGSGVALGGQDCAAAAPGAHTGDIAASMLADAGCRYVIVGHSERRAGHGETDEVVRRKAEAALAAGLVPIVCVGETGAAREAGRALATVEAQAAGSVPTDGGPGVVVAYEPVWAIGSGRTPTPGEVAEVHSLLRARFPDARLLYGGSVKPDNARELLGVAEVNGALVGGASLAAEDFRMICQAAADGVSGRGRTEGGTR